MVVLPEGKAEFLQRSEQKPRGAQWGFWFKKLGGT